MTTFTTLSTRVFANTIEKLRELFTYSHSLGRETMCLKGILSFICELYKNALVHFNWNQAAFSFLSLLLSFDNIVVNLFFVPLGMRLSLVTIHVYTISLKHGRFQKILLKNYNYF